MSSPSLADGGRKRAAANVALRQIEADQDALYLASLQEVLATHTGRVVLWRLLERAGIFREAFAESQRRTDYQLGRQGLGRQLYLELRTASLAGYREMEEMAARVAELRARALDEARRNPARYAAPQETLDA